MAPLTRSRARQPGNVPTLLNACYYSQRASAGLIISEATQVSQQGQGYAWTPGIHTREQIDGWQRVTDAVHKAGGLMFMQLWHVGRISHPRLQPDHMPPVAPSPVKPEGQAFIENERGEGQLVPFVTPRALQLEEMPYIVEQYVRGARNAQMQASTAWKSTVRTATCSISSSNRVRTIAPTGTAEASRTARGC
jgi:N-ethylmaleimide reductase